MANIMEKFSLKNKVALVTGGHGLYGKQITLAMAEAGAIVYTASRSLDKNEAYAKSLRELGYSVYADCYDQGDEESCRDMVKRIIEKEGKIDILINNSVLRQMQSYDDDIENFAISMQVNATGLFALSRIVGDIMEKQGNGSIINIGSYMGILGPDDYLYRGNNCKTSAPDYYFHKGGMTNLTKYLASHYGPSGVRCNVLILGGFFNNQDERFVEKYKDKTFLKRMAGEEDIKGICVFLASDASEFITGSVIAVDGGYTAK